MTASAPNASIFWRTVALLLTIVFVWQLFNHVGLGWFIVSALIAATILNLGLRGLGGFRTVGNIVLVLLIITSGAVTGVVKQLFPHTSKAMQNFPEQTDTKMAKGLFDPDQHLQTLLLDFGMFADSLERAKMDNAFTTLKHKVATEGLTPENKRTYDSLLQFTEQTRQAVMKILAGQKLAESTKQPTSLPTSEQKRMSEASQATQPRASNDEQATPSTHPQPINAPIPDMVPKDTLENQSSVDFVLDESFIRGAAFRSGDWQITEDLLPDGTIGKVLTVASKHRAALLFGSKKWVNYSFECSIKLLSGRGLNIYCRATDADNCYIMSYDPSCNNIVNYRREGSDEGIAGWWMDKKCPAGGVWCRFKVVCQGDLIQYYKNDELYREARHGGFFRGLVGVGTNNDETLINFANLRVRKLP